MNRDTCEHFTPISLRCAECEITTLQSELAAAKEENAKLRESAELLAEIDPASGLDEVSSNPLQLIE